MQGNIPPRGGIPHTCGKKGVETTLLRLNKALSGVAQDLPGWVRESDSKKGIAGILGELLGVKVFQGWLMRSYGIKMVKSRPPGGSIPPANRRRPSRLDRVSSLRAATLSGFIFVGSQRNQSPNQSIQTRDFKPHVIKSDSQARKITEAFRKAIAEKERWLADELASLREEGLDVSETFLREAEHLGR